MYKGLVSQVQWSFKSPMFYQTDIAWLVYVHRLVHQGAHSGGLPENLILPGVKFRGNLRFWKISTTDIEGVYMSCKFDFDILKGCGI